jgi:predicted esterase
MNLQSIDKHLYTIIILHGMYQDYTSLLELSNDIQKHNRNIKVILPNAPRRTINWSNGKEENIRAWYNYYTRRDGEMRHDIIEHTHFIDQTERINKIIDGECKLISSKNIIIAGVSQGGTIAFNIGLHSPYKLGGIIGIHTVFMDNIISINNMNKIPIYLFSGEKDSIYNIKLQKRSCKNLYKLNYKIEWYIESNLEHCEYSSQENLFIVNSIKQILLF